MLDTKAVLDCLAEWLENPYWGEYYNNAPSDLCKEYIETYFYASDTEDDDAFAKMDEIEPKLSLEDWKYLLKYSTGPEKGKITKKIAELEAAQNKEA